MADVALGDYINRNVIGELRRLPGVGRAQVFASQRALREWIDLDKMVGLTLTADDVNTALMTDESAFSAFAIMFCCFL